MLAARSPSLIGSVTLHAGLIAWMVAPSAISRPEPQQVIDIQVVMVSQPASEPAEAQSQKPAPTPLLPKPQARIPQPKPAQEKKLSAVQAASLVPTSGPQSPDATQKVAALTQPVFNAVYLHNTPPAYPPAARREGAQGVVLLDVDVTPQGAAEAVQIRRSSGYAALDNAAREAVRAWRFIPAKRGFEAMSAHVIVPVEFRLE